MDSIYDLISRAAAPSTLLQAKLIRKHLTTGVRIRWVPSNAQVADCLTKIDPSSLREILQV